MWVGHGVEGDHNKENAKEAIASVLYNTTHRLAGTLNWKSGQAQLTRPEWTIDDFTNSRIEPDDP